MRRVSLKISICALAISMFFIPSLGLIVSDQNEFNYEEISSINGIEFILPEVGCPMAHADPQMSDNNYLPPPTNNVKVVWHRNELPGERAGSLGLGCSGNGNMVACTFSGDKDNLIVYDYDGNHVWASGNLLNGFACASAPMVDVNGRVIACDNRMIMMVDPYDCDDDGEIVEWTSELSKGGLPISPVITEDGTLFLATRGGPIYIYDSKNGTLLAWRYLNADDNGFFETVNTPCVKGNRVYISTQHNPDIFSFRHLGRLYSIDVDSGNPNKDERLKIAWYYEFESPSGASPLLINKTIYFDSNRSCWKNPRIIAVTDMGKYPRKEWEKPYTAPIHASFARDPRGGFWIVDFFNARLVHFASENGDIIEEIDIDNLVHEKGIHRPSSVIMICGNEKNPIIIISATAFGFFKSSSYIIAIDLGVNNSLLWKTEISNGSLFALDFSFGQYPIIMKNGEPRIVFSTIRDGVYAIGASNLPIKNNDREKESI